jgi:hypothetical protein
MNTKMGKGTLLKKIQENRDRHRKIFEEALEGYRKKVIEILEEKVAALKANKRTELYIRLPEPQDRTKDYDRVIAMIKENLIEEIELTETEFAQYVLDDWQWKDEFLSVSNNYTATRYDR